MDIFNRKRVKELEEKLHKSEVDRDKYKCRCSELESKLDRIKQIENVMPADCERGHWCRVCEFARAFHYTEYYGYNPGSYSTETIYVCGKGETCKSFVPVEVKE